MENPSEMVIDFYPEKRMFALKLYDSEGCPEVDMIKYRRLEKALDSMFGFTFSMMKIVFSDRGDPISLWVDAR